MLVGGMYSSYDEPPNSSMFVRAGGESTQKKKQESVIVESFQEAIKHISTALSPVSVKKGSPLNSPMKLIDGRSKCYKQLSDLSNLKATGVLSDEEFQSEKEAIMITLKKIA